MNAKQLIESRLAAGSNTLDISDVGLTAGQQVKANRAQPLGLSETAESLSTIERPDRSTLGPNGNRASDLGAIATRSRLNFDGRSHSAPLGSSETGSYL